MARAQVQTEEAVIFIRESALVVAEIRALS